MTTLSSWGCLSNDTHQLHELTADNTASVLANAQPGIAYGMGRSYGDVCLNPGGHVWLTRQLNHLMDFDERSGVLRCESGVLLRDINRTFLPRGWLLAVSPGTELVSVGGAIANDVHGKNHHRHGSFGQHVLSIDLLRSDGEQLHCRAADADGSRHREMLRASIGGLGLTGLIRSAELQLRRVNSNSLLTETIAFYGLDDFFDLADSSEADWEYTVAWIDCLAARTRGIFMRANHTDDELAANQDRAVTRKQKRLPFTPPVSLVNKLSLRLFNQLYFQRQRARTGTARSDINTFFYPLDGIANWNRLYGARGFYQYQCVIPHTERLAASRELLQCIAAAGKGSMLSVLKTFGQQPSAGLLGFPMHGVTLALDFPRGRARHEQQTLALFRKLDAIVMAAGGRLYAAKDARMSANVFGNGYKNLADFVRWRDPGMESAMSRRLITPGHTQQDILS